MTTSILGVGSIGKAVARLLVNGGKRVILAERLIAVAGFDAVKVGGVQDALRIEVFGDLHQFRGLEGKVLDVNEARAAARP